MCNVKVVWGLLPLAIIGVIVGCVVGGIGAHNYINEKAALASTQQTQCSCLDYYIAETESCSRDEGCTTIYHPTFQVLFSLVGEDRMVNGTVVEYQDVTGDEGDASAYSHSKCIPTGRISPCWYETANITSVRFHRPSLDYGTTMTAVGFAILGFCLFGWIALALAYFLHFRSASNGPSKPPKEHPAGL